MKRLFLLVAILGSVINIFSQDKKKTKTNKTPLPSVTLIKGKNVTNGAAASHDDVSRMASRYLALVKKNPEKAIKQINLDASELSDLLVGVENFKLVFTADEKNIISVYLQFWRSDPAVYNNILILKDPESICPQFPTACEPDLPKSANRDVLHEYVVRNQANRYTELLTNKAITPVLQINMDALVLKAHLFRTKRLQLICAVNENKQTVVMQFWKDDDFYYYDINDFFNIQMPRMKGSPPVIYNSPML